MNANVTFLIQLLATWYMVGLIWMVQIVHYPLMGRVGEESFARYEAEHSHKITPIVGAPMLVELVTAAWMLFAPPPTLPRWVAVVGLTLLVLIWLSTAFIQVPCHQRLAAGFDAAAHQTLVRSNWLRTAMWTVRGVLLAYFAARLFNR